MGRWISAQHERSRCNAVPTSQRLWLGRAGGDQEVDERESTAGPLLQANLRPMAGKTLRMINFWSVASIQATIPIGLRRSSHSYPGETSGAR